MTALRETAKAALKKPAGPCLRALDRRIVGLHNQIGDVEQRTEQLRQEVNVDLETVAELILTFERFAVDFTDRIERITETLEAVLARMESSETKAPTSSLGAG